MDGILSGVMPARASIQCTVTSRLKQDRLSNTGSLACAVMTPNTLRGIAPRAALRRNNQNETAR
ncbi:hypothetical protein [Bradyrhizobium sp. 33ap4]|uniref:hypothetical protein n=1 Tax=Bradyrhizobium sp. 33ap4 TaxID=3061630 RepID=UPI00292F93C9|nr:hypothetical protein [Bradyrhizobium sp. 33ap4]